MTAKELLSDIHALEEMLLAYERRYGLRSEVFHASYVAGEEPACEAWVLDFSEWAGAYEGWLERQEEYRNEVARLQQQAPGLSSLIQVAA
jgi:hypothetical protein